MKKINQLQIDSWNRGLIVSPIDGFYQIFNPIKDATAYQFDTWGELVDTLNGFGIKVTLNGYISEDKEISLHILLYQNTIVGYATNPVIPYDGGIFLGYRVVIDSDVPLPADGPAAG